jgi:hypothetical protein
MATTKGGSTVAFNTAAGYDLATGLGSVNVANLIAKWAPANTTPSTTTLNLSNASPTFGSSVTVSGLVTPSTATGVVVLENASTGAVIPPDSGSSNAVTAGGNYNFTTSFLPAGSYSVMAHYGGDGTFMGSNSSPATVNIPKQNSQVVVSFVNSAGALTTASQNIPYGSNYILRVDVTNTSGTPCQNANFAVTFACPTGSITLSQNPGAPLNDFPNGTTRLNDRGFAEDQLIQLNAGSYSITATYTADPNSSFNSSTSGNTLSVTITKATTTTAVTSSPASIASGASVTLTATISSGSNSSVGPSGTVQFMNGTTALGSAMTCASAGAVGTTTGASCKATLTTALSQFIPVAKPRLRPNVPVLPLGVLSTLMLVFLALQRRLSVGRRLGYAAATLLLFACLAAGFAGCSGSKGGISSGGGTHTDSITAVYSGDANYSGSTSAAATVTVQ